MVTGGLLAGYLSPAMGFHKNHQQKQRQRQKENEKDVVSSCRYYLAGSNINSSSDSGGSNRSSGSDNSSSCRLPPPPPPSSSSPSPSLQQSTSFFPVSSSSSSATPSQPSSASSPVSLPRARSMMLSCSFPRTTYFPSSTFASSTSPSSSQKTHTTATRFSLPPLLVIPSILLLIVSNQGVRHVQGQQVWSDPHHAAAGFGQQYASFEELQRLTENPFENNTAVNVTVPLGDNAFLRCKVRNLGERSISWVRRRDWHILTSGKTTYTNDERFHVLHADGSDEWTLQIKFVQKRDNGTYECQVSTGTGIVSYLVHLMVAVPEAFILGNGEYHVEQGSTINLVCVIEKSPKPPEYIFWYHNDRMINYGSSREVKVHNEPGSKTHSRLTIRDALISDSGNYTCKTAHAEPASTLVYVSQGDQIAAIQKRKAAAAASSTAVTSFAPEQVRCRVPVTYYLAVSIIQFALLVPFLTQSSFFSPCPPFTLSSTSLVSSCHQRRLWRQQQQYYVHQPH